MDTTEHQHRSGEARTDLFAGVGGLIYTGIFFWLDPDLWAIAHASKSTIHFNIPFQ